MALVAGLRYHIGSDTANYIDYFEAVPNLGDFFRVLDLQVLSQPLWFLFLSVVKTLFKDFLALQLIHAFIVNLLIGKFIYNQCNKPFISLLAYYCCCWWNFSFEIMRESLCVAIYLNLLCAYVNSNNSKRFIVSSIPLLLIHMFAFIPIILTIIVRKLTYKQTLFFGFAVAVILFFTLDNDLIMKLLLLSDGFLSNSFADRVLMYAEGDEYGFKSISVLGYLFIIATSVAYPILVSKSKVCDDNYAKILLLYAFVIILRMKLLIFVRICNYWEIVLFVYAVNYIYANKATIKQKYIALCFIYSLLNGIQTFLTPQEFDNSKYDSRYIPYSSYIEKSLNPTRERLYY
ncbi:MAG: EpsG family protein [Alphaproteobacteria bacterium]|nr:EpsG family protein [Alphaproteobacteria bacterium]